LALCILGMDFLIYFLFQWMYGDKQGAIAKKVAAQRRALAEESGRPYLVRSNQGSAVTQRRVRKIRERMRMVEGARRSA